MNRMLVRALASLLVICSLLSVFAACGQQGNETDTKVEDATNASSEVISVVEGSKSDYTIIRSDTSSTTITKALVELKNNIKTKTGASLALGTDWINRGETVPTDTLEILVGDTNREESKALRPLVEKCTYRIKVVNNRVLIMGATDSATRAAVTYFIETYVKEDGIKLPADLDDVQAFEQNVTIVQIDKEVINSSPYGANDTARLLVSLQGLLNARSADTGCMLYIMNDSSDKYWLDYLEKEGNMFYLAEKTNYTSFDKLWEFIKPYVVEYGMVAWDEAVPATSNVAATICSVENFLPVLYSEKASSLYQFLKKEGVEEKDSLVGLFEDAKKGSKIKGSNVISTGSPKCDAYLWALDKYIDKTNPYMTAYVLDGASCIPSNSIYMAYGNPSPESNQIYNHDYLIQNKCFFWDLSVVEDEAPCDEKNQEIGLDYKTACTILQKLFDNAKGQMVQCIGFPMWWMKYTVYHNLGHTPEVSLEWKFAELITTYNCVMEADAANPCWLTNGSVYSQYQLKKTSYENNNESNSEPLKYDSKTRYFTIYLGDYDCSAWLKMHIPTVWNDSKRGTLPLMWGFNPNLADRVPMVFEYVFETMTENDYIVTGDSGAGYANPTALFNSNLRDGRADATKAWQDYNAKYSGLFNMDLCGFLLNGANKINRTVLKMYNPMYTAGSFTNCPGERIFYEYDGIVYYGLQMDIYQGYNIEDVYNSIAGNVVNGKPCNMNAFRTICQSPTFINSLVNDIIRYGTNKKDGYNYVYVDPYQFMELALQSNQAKVVS